MNAKTWPILALAAALTLTSTGSAMARTPPARTVMTDFTGDGRADLAVWNPATGYWRFGLLCEIQPQPNCGFSHGHLTVGNPTAMAVPGDYDGDGRAEPAVFDSQNGRWHIVPMDLPQTVHHLGQPGDLPAAADYNGDGRIEPAVFRPAKGTWLWADGAAARLGQPGDQPVPEDYDGDGRADLAVFSAQTGTWTVQRSSDGVDTHHLWGEAGDRAVPADYDGDGRADLAVFRPSTAQWWVLRSGGGVDTPVFGEPGSVPVPADYNGDGVTELAVFYQATALAAPKQGSWLIQGLEVIAFGHAEEIPAR